MMPPAPLACAAPTSLLLPPCALCTPFLSCSFLLQLGLLDLDCSGYAPSLQAAAALSLSLATFGKQGWPLSLQQFGSYLESDLAPCKACLAELQATQVGGCRTKEGGMLVLLVGPRRPSVTQGRAEICNLA